MWVIKQNKCNTKKKFCVLQKKVLSFGPNRTVEVRPNWTFGWSLWDMRQSWPYTLDLLRKKTLVWPVTSFSLPQRAKFCHCAWQCGIRGPLWLGTFILCWWAQCGSQVKTFCALLYNKRFWRLLTPLKHF